MHDITDFENLDVFTFDQLGAEYREAAELCPPGKNRRLRELSGVAAAIQHTLASADFEDIAGSVPVVRAGVASGVKVRGRRGDEPIRRTGVVTYCSNCNDHTGWTSPFWINCGTVIVQVDLCNDCAKRAMDVLDGQPQIGSNVIE